MEWLPLEMIAFDADDTLWENERYYQEGRQLFEALLAKYPLSGDLAALLDATEMRNLPVYGYGVPGFAFSMIETAIEATHGMVSSRDIQALVDLSKQMLTAEMALFAQAEETVARLSAVYPLMLITKGDLRHQLSKLERSGLKGYFQHVEVVQDKNSQIYADILTRHHLAAKRFLMVGNSLRSDILPVVALGGRAIYVPNSLTWSHEQVEPPETAWGRYYQVARLGEVPGLIEQLSTETS
jgi:putative hydrolase of the HAD superfamily